MWWAAAVMVVGQAAIIGTLLYFVRSFGGYTEALLRAHESNLLVRNELVRAIDELKDVKANPQRGVA